MARLARIGIVPFKDVSSGHANFSTDFEEQRGGGVACTLIDHSRNVIAVLAHSGGQFGNLNATMLDFLGQSLAPFFSGVFSNFGHPVSNTNKCLGYEGTAA